MIMLFSCGAGRDQRLSSQITWPKAEPYGTQLESMLCLARAHRQSRHVYQKVVNPTNVCLPAHPPLPHYLR